jgi:hypothetical protein
MASPERAILFLIYFWSMRIDDVCVHADEAGTQVSWFFILKGSVQ